MALTKVPSNLDATVAITQSASDNSTNVATTAYVTTALANLVDGAPSTLNTLDEIAAALNDDAALNTTLTTSIAAKLPLAGGSLTGDLLMRNGGNIELGGYNSGNDKGLILSPQDGSGYWHVYNTAGGHLAFGASNTIGSSEKMRIDSSGRVGVNQVPTVSNFALQVQGIQTNGTDGRAAYFKGYGTQTSIGSTGPTVVIQNANTTANNYAKLSFESGNAGETVSINAQNIDHTNHYGDMAFNTRGSGGYSEKMRITSNGNVGIGTTSPSSKLHAHHGTTALGFDTGIWSSANINPADYTVGRGAGMTMQNVDVYVAGMYGIREANNWQGALTFYTHNNSTGNTFGTTFTEKMRISSDGNVGIGTNAPTHSANYRTLDIRGTDGGQILAGRSSNMDFFMYTDSTSVNIGALNDIHFEAGSSGGQAPKLIIKSDGKVGIGTGTGTVSGNLHVEGGNAHNNVYVTSTANGGTGYDATLHLLGSASNSESKINLGSNNNPDAVSIKSYQNILTLRTNDEDRAYINASGQFLMNSNDGGSGKVTAANTWTGAKFIVRETNGFIDMQSSGDGQTVGYRLGFRENTDLAGYIRYGTGQAQMFIDNNYTGSSSQNEYSTMYFRNKNGSGTLKKRMRIGGANGYISTNPVGDAAQASQPFEVQGGTSGNIFMGNNLAGYTVGQYPVFGTSGNDLHFQANNTYTGYISHNSGFVDVSDEREKENITTISNATAKLKQLRGVTHTWKDNRDDGAIHLGLIAQEVQAVVPEVVTEGPLKPDETESTLGVSYQKLVPLLIETIKELEARITELEG